MTASGTHDKTGELRRRLLDAGLASLMAFLLGIPFIVLTTVDIGGRLGVRTRWGWLLAVAALALPGRLAVRWLFERQKAARARSVRPSPVAVSTTRGWAKQAGAMAIGVAVALPFVFHDNRYVVDTATTVLIYVMLGWGLNVVV